ncbi:MAG: N-acetyltransferase, partial [Clostridia bacterium]|nr:N-acetyltransferase [Clostridia bacterium]
MIKRVETARDRRAFTNFPLKLYAKNAHYAPLFYADEKALLQRKTNIYSDYSESEFFLAYDAKGTVVGRVGV